MRLNKILKTALLAIMLIFPAVAMSATVEELMGLGMVSNLAEVLGDDATINADQIPAEDSTYDLGSSTVKWAESWVDFSSIGSGTAQQSAELLHLKSGDDGLAVSGYASAGLLMESGATHFIQMNKPNNSFSGLSFNEGTDPSASQIRQTYTGSASKFQWILDNSIDMTLIDDPALIIGGTAQASSETLYVKSGDDGVAVSGVPNVNMVIEDSGSNFMSFHAPTSTSTGIYFSGGATGVTEGDGVITYFNHATAPRMDFSVLETNIVRMGNDRMQIQGNGNGVQLHSPDGTCSVCTVDNADSLTCASATCI